ncbi:hypothetical protein QAD02_013016 [Eretmocerus hayati]|uniref:Uncharacterized protein n=1 Tax=Eretmocerus hayati TaxID=131215 RepID=A0ACC2P107_9HYME|nr:hypothetical protein QAD02_013016 [Eretmocerus hayati]
MDSSELVSDDSVSVPETVYGYVPDETVPCISSCVAHDGSEECPDGFLVIDESTFSMEHVNGQNRVSVDGIDVFEAQSLSYVDNAVSNSSQQNHVDDLSGMNTSHQPFDKSSESNVATKSCSCTCKCFEVSADVTNQARVGQGSPNQDAAVQVDHKYSVLDMLRTDQQLSSATGIESFKLLDIIVNCMRTATDHKYEKKNIIMDTRKSVIMTYVKIKHNISYRFLSLVFGSIITEQHCGRIFVQTILMLNKIMKAIALPWPTRETIKRNLLQCFEGFENTRIVLDCTEIFIQKPQNSCCRIQVYSNYKGGDTIKLMTGVSPGGNMSFISKPYGGRYSDSAIFEQSELVNLLEPGDGVMVDKGFLIDEICEMKGLCLIRPPFLKNKNNGKFSAKESILTASIAKARVHVERFNQRIKVFDMLGGVYPIKLVPIIGEVFNVVCGTVNSSSPIIDDDKFMQSKV